MQKTAIIKEAEFIKSEARILADSLFDEGELDRAREETLQAISRLGTEETDELLACNIMLAKIERAAKRFRAGLDILIEAYPLAQLTKFHSLKAKFHHLLGTLYEEIAQAEGRLDYFDRALNEYTGSRIHLEEAGKLEDAGYIENNMGVLLAALGRFSQAHNHITAARKYFPNQPVQLAQIDETEARLFLREGNPYDALALMIDAQKTFLDYREKRLFDDSLPTLLKAISDYRMMK